MKLAVEQYVELEKKLDITDETLFERLYEMGLVMKVEDFIRTRHKCVTRKITITKPIKSVLDVAIFQINDAQDNPAGTISSIHDITLQEALVEETASLYEKLEVSKLKLQEQYEKLLELDEMKSAFIDTTAHELKTPLTSLKAYIEMLGTATISENAQLKQRAYKIVDRNVNHLIKLISNILDLARFDTGKTSFVPQPCNIYKLLSTVLKDLDPFFKKRAQTYQVKVPRNLPMIYADPEKLEQVLLNVLINAIAASFDNSVIELQGRFIEEDDVVEVEVKDYGIGITPQNQDKVFLRFFSPDSAHHYTGEADFRGQGAGLGLSISKEYIEMMGGRIWLKSEGIEGKGTSVFFTVPIRRDSKR